MIKRVLKRVISVFLVVVLLTVVFFVVSKPKKVSAVPIAAAPVIAGVVAFLGAAGISLTANGTTNGESFGDAIESIAKDFVFDNKKLADFYNDNTAVNFIIGKDGAKKVALYSTVFSNWLNEFADYVTTSYAIGSIPVPVFTSNLLKFKSGNYLYYTRAQIEASGVGNLQTTLPILGAGNSQVVVLNDHASIVISESKSYNRFWRAQVDFYKDGNLVSSLYNSIGDYEPLDAHKILFTEVNSAGSPFGIKFCVGNSDIWTVNVAQSFIDEEVARDSISVEGALNDGYEDFEQALNDAQTQAGTGENARIGVGVTDVPLNPPYTKENIAQGILDFAADVPLEGGLVGGYEDEKAAEEDNEGSIAPTGEMVGSNVVLVNGLEDFFPFCIPFDLYEIINLLNVPAEAPNFNWKMSFANRVDDYDIVIDLTPYNTVAAVFRTMIIIVFLIFLTLKTRDLIRG